MWDKGHLAAGQSRRGHKDKTQMETRLVAPEGHSEGGWQGMQVYMSKRRGQPQPQCEGPKSKAKILCSSHPGHVVSPQAPRETQDLAM